MPMYDPPHPGLLLRERMGEATVNAVASHLGIARVNLSRILNGHAAITAAVAVKISEAFPKSSPEFWMRLQIQYDLWQASQAKRARLAPFKEAA